MLTLRGPEGFSGLPSFSSRSCKVRGPLSSRVAKSRRSPRPSLRRRVLRRPPYKIPVGPSLAATGAPGDVTDSGRPYWSISIVAGYLNYKNSRRAARSSRHLGSALLPPAVPAPGVGRRGPAQPGSGGRCARSAANRSRLEPRCRAPRDSPVARRAQPCSRCIKKIRRMSTPKKWRQPSSRGRRLCLRPGTCGDPRRSRSSRLGG